MATRVPHRWRGSAPLPRCPLRIRGAATNLRVDAKPFREKYFLTNAPSERPPLRSHRRPAWLRDRGARPRVPRASGEEPRCRLRREPPRRAPEARVPLRGGRAEGRARPRPRPVRPRRADLRARLRRAGLDRSRACEGAPLEAEGG